MHYGHIISTAAFILFCMVPHHSYVENKSPIKLEI